MLTAGIAIAVGGGIDLDLSYRYTDAGEKAAFAFAEGITATPAEVTDAVYADAAR